MASIRRAKELMPAKNPPVIFRTTPDNREWTFLQTFPDYGQMQKFRRKSQCRVRGTEKHRRVRFACNCNRRRFNCQFKLLALKTTKQGYHVYTFGEHNHPAIKLRKKQQPAPCGHQQKQQEMEMEVDGEEDEEGAKEAEGQDGPIGEGGGGGGGGGDEDDDIIVIEDEDDIIEVEQKQDKEKREGPKEKITESPLGNEVANSGLQKRQEIGDKAIKIEQEEQEDDAEKEGRLNQPPRKMIRNCRGQKEKRAIIRRVREPMPAENPPRIFHTPDNIEWAFLQTFANYGQLLTFGRKIRCVVYPGRENHLRFRLPCNLRWWHNCPFKLLALKNASDGYHVYTFGEHNHAVRKPKKKQQPAARGHDHQKQREMEDKAIIEIEQEEEENEAEKGDEEVDEAKEHGEQKEDDDTEKQPPRKVTKNFRGGQKEYIFLEIVKSVEELDEIRFKHSCLFAHKPLPTFTSLTMPCARKKSWYEPGKQCQFELLAVHQGDGTIHVYAHSEHNHSIVPEDRRANVRRTKELMPAENPPRIFRTVDNIEWTYLRTFADYGQMQEFRRKSRCTFTGRENYWRFRLFCERRWSHSCEFKLLALKTTSAGYHVYKFGEHSHPIKKKKNQQPADSDNQQKQQGMEVDEKEEVEKVEDDEDGQEENEVEEGNEEEEEKEDLEGGTDQDQQEVKREDSIEIIEIETPLENEANPREEILELEERLTKAVAKVYKWMAGIEPNQIGPTLGAWDNSYLLKMVEMADQEIQENPEKFLLWRPFLKVAIKKCMSQMDDFSAKYKDLILLMVDHA